MNAVGLNLLIVDDEALARVRLRTLLADCPEPQLASVTEAASAVQAMQALQHQDFDAVLLDIHLPGTDGLALAQALRQLPQPPALIFVTAYAEHAVQAFELEALDYLTKPVRLQRLQAALQKVQRLAQSRRALSPDLMPESVLIQDRGRSERVPLSEVLYFKAEWKYLTVRTSTRSYLLEGSLNELEARFGQRFLRIHRNALVARSAVRALEHHSEGDDNDGWVLRLNGVEDWLAVSRRHLAAVREQLAI